jgi:hypothetical protein
MVVNPPTPQETTIVVWDMRRLYNEGDIRKRAARNEYDVKQKFGTPQGVSRRIPKGSQSVGTYYYEHVTGEFVAYCHHYVDPNGKQIGTLDPKILRIGGVEYHLPEKGAKQPDRIGNSKINEILQKTGWRSLATYYYHVEEQAKKIWATKIRSRLIKWKLMEKREWLFA